MNKSDAELIALARQHETHLDCEDCWYSCATITCNDARKNNHCDCGADRLNSLHEKLATRLSELIADKERLDAMDRFGQKDTEPYFYHGSWTIEGGAEFPTIREAIDAAIAQERKDEKAD